MKVTFLEGRQPFTKTITPKQSRPYPMLSRVTSHTEEVETLLDFFDAIKRHAAAGHALLKGTLHQELIDESRRGTTKTSDPTQWLCLDFDGLEGIDDPLVPLGLDKAAHIIQWSASAGLKPGLRAHYFFLLDRPVPAPFLKAWLQEQNLKHFAPTLSHTANALSWPLDITVCQNDKLIYIAPPLLQGIKDPYPKNRIEYRAGEPTVTLTLPNVERIKTEARTRLNTLRQEMGLAPFRTATKIKDGFEIQAKPDRCVVTATREDNEFVRLNLNGGDSWAYWHPVGNFEYIHDFKTGLSYLTRELVPDYWNDMLDGSAVRTTESGQTIFGFCDIYTSTLWKGLVTDGVFERFPARNERQIQDWYLDNGCTPPPAIEQWWLDYDPSEPQQIDFENRRINSHIPTEVKPKPGRWPTIEKLIRHMLGDPADDLYAHFINWFACIATARHRPLTAYVLHGTEGTGKGMFLEQVVNPLLHPSNVRSVMAENLEDGFNSWLTDTRFVFVDEVDVGDFKAKGRVTAKCRNYITEPTISVRAMRQSAVNRPNHSAWMFASNQRQPVKIPPGDRRYNVANRQEVPLRDVLDPAHAVKAIAVELPAFLDALHHMKLDPELANSIIETEARELMAEISLSSPDMVADFILKGDFESLQQLAPPTELMPGFNNARGVAYAAVMERIKDDNKITRTDLGIIFECTVGNVPVDTTAKLSRYLAHHGISLKRIRTQDGLAQGIHVQWRKPTWQSASPSSQPSSSARKGTSSSTSRKSPTCSPA